MKKYVKKIVSSVYICVYLLLSHTMVAYATPTPKPGDVSGEKVVTGTQSLVNWATGILMAISAAVTAFLIIKEILQIQAAHEETDTKPYYKRIRTIVIAGISILLVEGILNKVFSFYI